MIAKNNAWNPANGTVVCFSCFLVTKNTVKEKNREKLNKTINDIVGKPTANAKKKNKSPNPKTVYSGNFNLNLAYKNSIETIKKTIKAFVSIEVIKTSFDTFLEYKKPSNVVTNSNRCTYTFLSFKSW